MRYSGWTGNTEQTKKKTEAIPENKFTLYSQEPNNSAHHAIDANEGALIKVVEIGILLNF